MRSPRKKWRLVILPSFKRQPYPSMKRAYEAVAIHRALYAEGMSNVHQVNVEMDDGEGWGIFERVVFPQRVKP